MTYKSSDTRPFGYAILAALFIAADTVTPLGPILVYPWLVPVVGPVLPKPKGVPSRAKAEYQWKGFGLVWAWEDRITSGCASWWAAESFNEPVRVLHVFDGGQDCKNGEPSISRLSFLEYTTFGTVGNSWPYGECPFDLSDGTVSRYLVQVEELRDANAGELEANMLQEMRSEIQQIDRLGLRAQQYGCRINN